MKVAAARPEVTELERWTVVMLLEYWHTTYLEEGVCEDGEGQPGGDVAVTLDNGDALGVLAYNKPGGRHV